MVGKPAGPDRFVVLSIDMDAVAKAAVAFSADPTIGERLVGPASVLDLAATGAPGWACGEAGCDDAGTPLTLSDVIFSELLRRRFRCRCAKRGLRRPALR